MSVPAAQMWAVAKYVLGNRLRGRKHAPLVLMLEPLFRCNLACAGCGKIQHPKAVLKQHLTPEQCFAAAEECGAPIVSLPGGEPLLHPQIDEVAAGLVERRKFVYLCTNAILLEANLEKFEPNKRLSFSVHIDGPREEHDHAVCREGVFDQAISAIRAAVKAGFRVTTNTTLFNTAEPERVRQMLSELTELGVEGMMISPGYAYEKAPDQDHFLHNRQTVSLFRRIFDEVDKRWNFNQSPLFLEFLRGNWNLECTPWGSVTFNLFGWQRPCYLFEDGYASSFRELIKTTDWSRYGTRSGNPNCTNCMVHCGYEPTAVAETFGSWKAFAKTAKLAIRGLRATPRAQQVASR